MIVTILFALVGLAGSDIPVDALIGKIGRDPILQSDLQRFKDVYQVLDCAKLIAKEFNLNVDQKKLLEIYIEEELMYQDARARKISSAGLIQQSVKAIHKNENCKLKWQKLGEQYSKAYRTENRIREGESLLVRELEKRILVDKFRKTEVIADGELWKREAKTRYPVKVYLE
jgi:hypothetical protein